MGNAFKLVKSLKPVDEIFRLAVNGRSNLFENTSQEYQVNKISKFFKSLQVKIKSNMFDPRNPVSILSFLNQNRVACDYNDIKEGAKMWLFPHFLKKPSNIALTVCLRLVRTGPKYKEGKLKSYCKLFNHLLS